MRILLINPSMNYEKYGIFGRFLGPQPCLGLACIAAVLEKEGFETAVYDDFVLNGGVKNIIEFVKKYHPDIVGISCLTPSCNITYGIAREIKNYNRNIFIVLGNIHASFFAEKILEKQAVDAVVHNEGEYPMLKIAQCIRDRKDLSGVKGITFRKNGEIIHTEKTEILENLDALPYPAWHLLPVYKYRLPVFAHMKTPVLTAAASRGCPYNCSFCSANFLERRYRKRNPGKVVDEIEYLVDRFKIRQVGFVDTIFPLTKEQGLETCNRIVERKLNKKIVWVSETRVDRIDEELLRSMKEAGCERILFGIESGVQELLDNVNKDFTLDDVKYAIRCCKEAGIEIGAFFMLGLPGETKELSQKTVDFAKELDVHFVKFSMLVPLPGSRIYNELTKEGKLNRDDFENFTTYNPQSADLIYVPDGMTKEELAEAHKAAHLQFYIRPKMLLRQLRKVMALPAPDIFFGVYSFMHLLLKQLFKSKGNVSRS